MAECRLRWRFSSRAWPIEIPRGATHWWASRQMIGRWAEASRFPAGNPRTTRFGLQPKPSRAQQGPAMQTGIPDQDAPDCVCLVLSSSYVLSQRLSKFSQSGADSRLHRPEGLIQLLRCFLIRQFREKRGLDRNPFVGGQDLQRIPQHAALFLKQTGLLRVDNVGCRPRGVWVFVHPLFSLVEAKPIDCPAARLIHDPADDRPVSRIIGRGFSPHVIKHVERDFFGSFSIHDYPQDQRKDDPMGLLVNGMQCTLVTACDGSDELQPLILGYTQLCPVGIENIPESLRIRRHPTIMPGGVLAVKMTDGFRTHIPRR